ncbi:MAG TPA: ABC transporter permease [Candidatus Limnocylindria bacterium]|nr:ABC transporter permease [Candidatus Limnocylindria bacterium]
MLTYTLRKLIQVPFLLFGVVVVLFLLVHLAPGDPVAALLGDAPASPEFIEEFRRHLGLDRPLHEQFLLYVWNVLHGDLGTSYYYSQSVLTLILERFPPTLLLMTSALVAATLIGIVLGVVAAARPNSAVDAGANLFAIVGYSLPVFWLGELALLVFALNLDWFPVQGVNSLRESYTGPADVLDRAHHLVLPAFVLATRYIAIDFRLTRSGILEVLSQEYILTARAKGLASRVVLFRHALRNALLPVVTVTGLNVGFALSGAVLTEVVFGWPGLGRLTLDAIAHRDSPVLMGIFLFVTTAVVLVNFITDLVYAMVDPRIRLK